MVSTECISMDNILSFVGKLPARGQVRLHDSLTVRDLAPGDVLFWRGDEGGSVYFVESGELSVWWEDADGEQELMRFAGRGDTVTPAALLNTAPRQRSCLAEVPTRVIELSTGGFRQLTAMDPGTACQVLEALSLCAMEHPDSVEPGLQSTWLESLPAPD